MPQQSFSLAVLSLPQHPPFLCILYICQLLNFQLPLLNQLLIRNKAKSMRSSDPESIEFPQNINGEAEMVTEVCKRHLWNICSPKWSHSHLWNNWNRIWGGPPRIIALHNGGNVFEIVIDYDARRSLVLVSSS